MVQGKMGKEGGRVRVISEKKYPALKKTLAPLYVGETIISLAISRGLEKKNILTQTKSPIPTSKVK